MDDQNDFKFILFANFSKQILGKRMTTERLKERKQELIDLINIEHDIEEIKLLVKRLIMVINLLQKRNEN